MSELGTTGEPIKLKRDDARVKIFDFEGVYKNTWLRSQHGSSPYPSPEVNLQFGQMCELANLDEKMLISVVVTSHHGQTLASQSQGQVRIVGGGVGVGWGRIERGGGGRGGVGSDREGWGEGGVGWGWIVRDGVG